MTIQSNTTRKNKKKGGQREYQILYPEKKKGKDWKMRSATHLLAGWSRGLAKLNFTRGTLWEFEWTIFAACVVNTTKDNDKHWEGEGKGMWMEGREKEEETATRRRRVKTSQYTWFIYPSIVSRYSTLLPDRRGPRWRERERTYPLQELCSNGKYSSLYLRDYISRAWTCCFSGI